ncbi:cyclic nucleotide-binding domain-containing protein [Nannocystis sp.]|uniref:protein kinase domain-containing protein n=1 Tax=Nannocystis sp. TaxID=1962667 RepID=UPI0025E78C68|nr:cyclic nucleotide-binding domain-containing protein [Nannocystis sp.]MBK7825589.1 cyclic nucleotide-binding domain-containing protein [Nannocystis sp.]
MAIDEYDIPLTTIRGVSRPDRLDPRTQALLNTVLPALMDRLRFGPEIAAGGVGAVRVAFDRSLQRRIAAKVLHDRSYGHYLLVHGFIREAQVTGQLDHPNIAPIYELGRDPDGGLFFTMKLLAGRTLFELIAGKPAREPERLHRRLGIFLKVCDALAFAHSRGVLHCDIKPGNVLVGGFGEVYLMDWGSAKLLPLRPGADPELWVREALPPLDRKELEGIIFGTPEYMSPEQAMGHHDALDERSDVFLLGALLYELLTGQPPYSETETRLILRMAELGDVASPDTVVGSAVTFPPELVRITMKALAPRPADRYPSVIALQDDIHALLRGGGSFEVRSFPADTLVIREGEVGEAAYIVQKGKLQVFKAMGNARLALRKLGPGDVFGETAIFAASPRTASVIALEDSELIVVTRAVIDQELGSMQPWLAAFVRTLASRFGGVDDEAATPPLDKNG